MMSVPQQSHVRKISNTQPPVRKLSNTQAPVRKLSNTQPPVRRLSNPNNIYQLPARQHSKTERSISTTSNLTTNSPRKTGIIRKSSVPQRLGELKASDSWCSKKNDHHSRSRAIDPKSGTHPKSRKTSDLHFPNMKTATKPTLWNDIRQAFSHVECESSGSSLTLMSDHIVSMTEQPSFNKPNRKSSVRSGPITASKKAGFASVATYIQNCASGQKHGRVKSTGKLLWHRGVLALNIQNSR